MTSQPPVSQPPGWYPDPYAAAPGVERWWDGVNWIAQTRDPVEATPTWAPAPWPAAQPTAPAQQQLAGFGSRVVAYLIDLVPFVVLASIVLGQFGYFAIVDRLAAGDQGALAELEAMASAGSAASVTTVVVGAIAYFLYNVGFHRWKGQTPGKMLVGIRVRMADEDRRPSGRAAVIRWAVQQGVPQVLSTVPLVGLLASVFTVVDHLWPLFDAERRALHDKAAGTIVVRAR